MDMEGREIHVLAVDDSHLDRKVVERLLKNSCYKVTTVDSASRALEVLGIVGTAPLVINEIKINLIITDYCMPEMTGYDLLKKVKESSALKEIPVVIMSSENVSERITRCLAEGAKEFIIKPLRVADVKRLRSHINDGELNDDLVQSCGFPRLKRKQTSPPAGPPPPPAGPEESSLKRCKAGKPGSKVDGGGNRESIAGVLVDAGSTTTAATAAAAAAAAAAATTTTPAKEEEESANQAESVTLINVQSNNATVVSSSRQTIEAPAIAGRLETSG